MTFSPQLAAAQRHTALRSASIRVAAQRSASHLNVDRQVAGIRKGASLRAVMSAGATQRCATLLVTPHRVSPLRVATQSYSAQPLRNEKTVRSPAPSWCWFPGGCPTPHRCSPHDSALRLSASPRNVHDFC